MCSKTSMFSNTSVCSNTSMSSNTSQCQLDCVPLHVYADSGDQMTAVYIADHYSQACPQRRGLSHLGEKERKISEEFFIKGITPTLPKKNTKEWTLALT